MKIGKFISTVISIALAVTLEVIIYKYLNTGAFTGVKKLGAILLVPISVIVFLLLYSSLITSGVCSISALFSSSKVIKIISVILLLVSIALIVCAVFLTKSAIQQF